MKKVLFVMYSLINGGAERSLVNLLNEIDPERYSVDLLLFSQEGMYLPQLPEHVKLIDPPHVLPALYARKRPGGIRSFLWFLFKVGATGTARIREKKRKYQDAYRWAHFYKKVIPDLPGRYDIAVAYHSSEIMMYTVDKVEADKKVVFIHNDYKVASHAEKYEREYFRDVQDIVTISPLCVESAVSVFPEYEDKIHYLPNITSSEVIRKRSREEEPADMDGSKTSILSVGRLTQQKGYEMAVSAASIMKKRGYSFCWYVIGNGELEGQLKDQIEKEDVQDCFVLLGVRENPYVYMRKADIVAQTSLWEGKSMVLDEAKILGRPILSTSYPSVRDQIEDGKEGIVVGMSPEEIADGMIRMIDDEALRKDLSEYLMTREYGNVDALSDYYDLFER